MNRLVSIMLAGSAISTAMPALAQEASPEAATAATEANAADDTNDIIVSARRRAESLQEVPQTIQAVSGQTLEKLNLYQFDDLSKVVSGVTLARGNQSATMRGVSFNPFVQTTPTVSFYLNESPVQPTFAFQAMFDIGQIEVLRGPQGTLRGQSAPTGAFLISSRRPDLQDFGGYVNATITDQDARRIEGGINIPVIKDVLALRVSGMLDRTNNGGIRSVNSAIEPRLDSNAFRVSARFEPTSNLSAVLLYQQLNTTSISLGGAVFGNGSPGTVVANPTNYGAPFVPVAGYNGRPIAIGERLSVFGEPEITRNKQQFASALVDWRIGGQKLSYVGGWTKNDLPADNISSGDTANLVNGGFIGRVTISRLERFTHEFRVSSNERLFGFLDYVAGVFYARERTLGLQRNSISFQAGAFGSPLGPPSPVTPDMRYSTESLANSNNTTKETSFFGNLTAHLFENTELSGGVRFIRASKDALRINSQTASLRARPITGAFTAGDCTAGGGVVGATYAGVCDFPVASSITGIIPDVYTKTPMVWSASLAHHFTPDLMIYANYGTSFRPGPAQGALTNGANNPDLTRLSQLKDETSKSIEVGVKSSWFDGKLTVNAAYYHQKYSNFVLNSTQPYVYLVDTAVSGVARTVSNQATSLNVNVDGVVDGVDLDIGFRPSRNFSLSGSFSYSNGRFANASIPCIDNNFDGTPDTTPPTVAQFEAAGKFIAFCQLNGRTAALPKWNMTLRSEYSHPIQGDKEAFISGLLSYQPENPYASTTYVVPAYTLINLYVGVRDQKAGWEIQAFAKNLTNNKTITNKTTTSAVSDTPNLSGVFGASGYNSISYLAPREFGLTLRYAFGSH